MSQPLQNTLEPIQDANLVLASQILEALCNDEIISTSDNEVVLSLLTSKNVKAGDWLQLLEKNIISNTMIANTDNAATHHQA